MMKKILYCLLLSICLLLNQNVVVHVNSIRYNKKKLHNNDKKGDCIDLADFHYEIVLGVTSFPQQGDCSDQEEAEIATLLQKTINDELNSIPGTIKTQNKVCNDPINNRRRFLTVPTNQQRKTVSQKNYQRNLFLRRRRHRSFIYVGGGRCRFCFKDNADHRLLFPQQQERDVVMPTISMKRNLLFLYLRQPRKPIPKVADILLCQKRGVIRKPFFFSLNYKPVYHDSIHWINARDTQVRISTGRIRKTLNLIGPYLPGESFGVQVDMQSAMETENKRIQQTIHQRRANNNRPMVELPIKQGTIHFELYAFDLSTTTTTTTKNETFLTVDPLVIFINGVKLDFNLLMSHPNVVRTKTIDDEDEIKGDSFAGIQWRIIRPHYDEDFAYGVEPDRMYKFYITAPLVVLSHKNQFDVDFILKPTTTNFNEQEYAIGKLLVSFNAPRCQVTDLENSPFQDFQSVVESRLFHQLGLNLAHEFQNKEGHCLQDKIPVVNVHLVEKESWKESNPQCGK